MNKKYLKPGLILAGLALLLLYTLKSAMGPSPTLPRVKDAAHAERESVAVSGKDFRIGSPPPERVGGNGIIEPRDREIRVAGIVPGRILKLLVKEGASVTAGQPLVEFEADAERATLAAAEGDLLSARAELLRVTNGSRREDVEAVSADAQAARLRANLTASQRDRERVLSKAGASTRDEIERSEWQAEIDERTAKATESRAASLSHGSRYEDILAAKARVQASEARRALAKIAVERLVVNAPISGKVVQVKVRSGEYYSPGGADPLLILCDTSVLRARIDVDERMIGYVAVGRHAYVTADAYPGKRFEGQVVEVGQRMGRKNLRTDDPVERVDTKILEVVIDLDTKDGLIPGLRVAGWISAQDQKG